MLRLLGKDMERGEEELQDFIDFTHITAGRHDLITKWYIRNMVNNGK